MARNGWKMTKILTCTFAPTAMGGGPQLLLRSERPSGTVKQPVRQPSGAVLRQQVGQPVLQAEALGIDYLLIAQRWWGNGIDVESSTYDCLAMTGYYAAVTERIRLITAIHPGFFSPAPIAKWGATIDRLTGGRWAVNVVSGWHMREFPMYGADMAGHDARYDRSGEFIDILRAAWNSPRFDYDGRYYQVKGLELQPRPVQEQLEVFQGGQSDAAMAMAAERSDWMFLNGGPPEKIGRIIEEVRARTKRTGRKVRFALHTIGMCRRTDAEAEAEIAARVAAIDPKIAEARRAHVTGAQGMWAETDDKLARIDTNEGYASRLIGSPDTILRRMNEFHLLGVDMFLVTLHDPLFNSEVLPAL